MKAARLLLNHGADVNAKDGEGKTPIDNASMGAFYREYYQQQVGSIESDKISPLLEQAGSVSTE
ncbi:MAG TPA: ankyrin repeat domain-containing protein [Rhodospirillales bacterium]|nr:ankyrin repeat domain-containing protein [Rhodospirillales bacterium]